MRNVYSNRKVFDRISIPIVTPIFSPQRIQDNYFPHCETPLMAFLGDGGQCWNIFICIGRSSDTSFEKSLNPHHFGKISFQILASTPYIGGLSNYSPHKSLYSQNKIQENMGYGDVPPHFGIFKNHEKADNYCTTSLKCFTLNTNLFHAVHSIIGL